MFNYNLGPAFTWSYLNGYVKLAKLIAFAYPNAILHINQTALDAVCAKEHFNVAQWFLKLNPYLLVKDEYRFKMDWFNGHLSYALWLHNINVNNAYFDINALKIDVTK